MDPCKSAQLGCGSRGERLADGMRAAAIMLDSAADVVEAGRYSTEELAEKANALQDLVDAMRRSSVQVIEPREVSP